MGGMEGGIWGGMKPDGDAETESGEVIRWRDVDVQKLNNNMNDGTGADYNWKQGEPDSAVKVNDTKSPKILGLPSTKNVRDSLLKPSVVSQDDPRKSPHYVDPYVGFSNAAMNNTPVPSPLGSRAETFNPSLTSDGDIFGSVRSLKEETNNSGYGQL